MQSPFGHFNDDGTEFIVSVPKTPRAFDNFLWNDAIFSNVQQTGVGYADYQVGEGEAVQLLTGIGRVCDFDVFGRDGLMSRLVYIRDNVTKEFWTLNWEPVLKNFDHYECVHGLGYSIITNVTEGIEAKMRIFVPQGKDPCELWTLTLKNLSNKKRDLSIFVYNQFQFKFKWGFESYGDMIFRGSWFNKSQNAMIANKHPHKKPHDYLTGFITADRAVDGWDGTRDAFVGTYNTLQNPDVLVNGNCTQTPGSSDATIGVLQFNLSIPEGKDQRLEFILGATDKEENVSLFKKKFFGQSDRFFEELKEEKRKFISMNHVKTPDPLFDNMLNAWTKQETAYGAKWCRWGWMGYRDIVQHGFGVASFNPTRTREILLEAFRYQYANGMALRGWNPVDKKPYSDSALWLVFTLIAYLKETGDFGFLDVKVPYFDEKEGTVQEHIDQALSFLESNKGSHGLVLIKFGDWNDSLTAVGKEGRGESIWLSEAYAEAMLQMESLASHLKQEKKKADYRTRYESIKKAINEKAWDGDWYVRCYDDNGNPIGSHKNTQGKIFTNAQSWAMIAGISDVERTEKMIASLDKITLTDLGHMLLAPTFFERDESVGRISCLEPGVCENGTIYSHVNIWMILGLLRVGKADQAYELFKRITPSYLTGKKDDPKLKVPPFVYANCYYGPDHRNNRLQMEFTWITGSVAWFYNVLLNEMLGAKSDFSGLKIEPCLPKDWKEISVDRQYRGTVYRILLKNPEGLQTGTVSLKLDGKALDGNILPDLRDGKTHQVEAILKKA